ncbi:hypothetical protein BBJ29_000870 [Phytophthora kernoviae]|uniref:Spindle pole body component n=1 Tax=Phytophthora kernoviae TaxID=325452 RepID=A0A3R7JP75_9STRA|nr:hypothetical protein BBJ29_000870 [Phytophthora kernoviae]
MHHELFLALLGHTGDVIERRSDGFFVRADAGFLSQAQKSVLNRLLRLGFAFSCLDQFARQAASLPSVYLHALAQAVERQLQRYSDAVVGLEAKILRSSAVFPLSNLMFELEEFMEVLPEVCALVSKLQAPTEPQSVSCIRGAKLLSVVHRSTSSGFPRVRKCMQELLYACHRVLFKQILSWMIYGEIVDPYGEFFIKKQTAVGSDGSAVSTEAASVYGNSASALLWHQQFSMDLGAVPLDYFPTAVAESVFVIGKAVHILTRANEFTPREEQEVIKVISELAQRPEFDVITVEHAVEKVRRHVASRLHEDVVVKSDFVGYLRVLKGFFLLSRGEVFQAFIERSFEAERIASGTRVMVRVKPSNIDEGSVRPSLFSEIPALDSSNSALRVRVQYARQEVSTTSSKHITFKKMMAVFVNNVLVLETRFDLQQALDLHSSIDEYWIGLAFSSHAQLTEWSLDKFSAKTSWLESSGNNLKDHNALMTPRKLWHALTLRCAVRWPLQLLVTPDLLRSYAHLFQFCFRLKRVAHALELAWKSNILRSKSVVRKGASFAASALRIRMSFVVRTLELHFQVFVIENKFKKCVAQIESAGDFDRAKRLHETFVASVVKSCYVHTKTVASALDELLACCWQFAEYVLQQDAVSDDECALSADRVALLDQDFHRRFEFLYSVLQISEARDLLFLLDSNGFFAAERERRKRQLQ